MTVSPSPHIAARTEAQPGASAESPPSLRVLFLTNQWPRRSTPACGIMVVRQVEDLRRLGVRVEVISISGEIRSYARAARAVLRLNARGGATDVLHAHTGHSGVLACLQLRYPVVLTYVGYDIDTPAEDREGPRTQLERFLFRSLSMLFAATIAQSARGARRLPRLGQSRNRVIPNGVDARLFMPIDRDGARERLGWGPEPTVLFAADPTRYTKHFELAQAAVDQARAEFPDLRLVVGGEIPAAEMVLWMNASDALILTSRGEGSPNVVKEAMFCNLPIVTVDVGDVREIIGAARHCHICPPDPGSLAHGLTSVLRSLPERSDGRERSDWIEGAIVAGRLIELYQEARRRGPGVLGFLGSGTFAND